MEKNQIVKNYLEELNIDHEIKTLDDITTLIKAHVGTFCFASLKVLLDEDISLDLETIYENLVVKKRGGYCFEHNKLMYEVLKELGFDVEHYLARVINNSDNIPPQTHRFTVLNYEDERYILDVGIGFRIPSVPLKFGDSPSIGHLGIEYSIVKNSDDTYSMQLIEKGKPYLVTKFDLNKCYEVDFEMGHFYSHKSPNAIFVNNFVASLIQQNVICSIINSKYLKIYEDRTQEIDIKSLDQLELILKNDMNLNYTTSEVEKLFNKFIAS